SRCHGGGLAGARDHRLPAIHQARPGERRRPGDRDAVAAEQDDVRAHQVPGAGDRGGGLPADDQPLGARALVRLNRIYTRTGDDGTTGLVDGSRAPKHAPRLEAIGAVDEANSALGWAVLVLGGETAGDVLRVQNDLFDLGADLATPGEDFTPSDMVLRIVPAQVEWLEGRIDAANEGLEPLRSLILPGGSEAAARLHVARAAVR